MLLSRWLLLYAIYAATLPPLRYDMLFTPLTVDDTERGKREARSRDAASCFARERQHYAREVGTAPRHDAIRAARGRDENARARDARYAPAR